MSEVTLTIKDAQRHLHGRVHGSVADRVVAALSAEPETIAELEAAVTRFIKPRDEGGLFDSFREGLDEEPWDAGIVLIDLAARVVASDSTYSFPPSREVQYHDGQEATDIWIPYQMPDDWLLTDSLEEWRALAPARQAERAAKPSLETRSVLYGKVAEFIVAECLATASDNLADPLAAIHARWLMTPRDDLQDRAPRDWLLAKREFIDLDLQWREYQWSLTGVCPPGLSPESAAYRYGGYGTHENVLYYELVRHLIEACWRRVSLDNRMLESAAFESEVETADQIQWLQRVQRDWLHSAQSEMHGMSPFLVIEYERARLPIAHSPELMSLDDDCPFCQMLQEADGPCFWHLDGSGMEDDFAFSFHCTREEWEEEKRRWEAFGSEPPEIAD